MPLLSVIDSEYFLPAQRPEEIPTLLEGFKALAEGRMMVDAEWFVTRYYTEFAITFLVVLPAAFLALLWVAAAVVVQVAYGMRAWKVGGEVLGMCWFLLIVHGFLYYWVTRSVVRLGLRSAVRD
jgi:hypothetical protein